MSQKKRKTKKISVTEARKNWFDLVDYVAEKRGTYTINKHGKDVAVLEPVKSSSKAMNKRELEIFMKQLRHFKKTLQKTPDSTEFIRKMREKGWREDQAEDKYKDFKGGNVVPDKRDRRLQHKKVMKMIDELHSSMEVTPDSTDMIREMRENNFRE